MTFVAGDCWHGVASFLYAFEFWTAAATFPRGWNLGNFLAFTTCRNWILGTRFALDLAFLAGYVTIGTENVLAHFDFCWFLEIAEGAKIRKRKCDCVIHWTVGWD